MGLTIHYGIKTDCTDLESARSVVLAIRELAKRLPFREVGDIVKFKDHECDPNLDDVYRWIKIQAGQYVREDDYMFKVQPLHFIGFTTIPGEGSEPTNFGLARYPDTIEPKHLRRTLRTNLPGWSWKSFCKTQYASAPAAGGVANFVRCHLSIVELLHAIQKQQLAHVEVNDEGEYWDHRDVRKLAETVGEWNEMVAAVVGQLKDAANGVTVEAPVTQFPDFERLEARGRDKLDRPAS